MSIRNMDDKKRKRIGRRNDKTRKIGKSDQAKMLQIKTIQLLIADIDIPFDKRKKI